MGTHKQLEVWKNSIELVKEVYRLTAGFPREEIFGLTSQLRRSAVSVPANISEGSARIRVAEFIHFLRISFGSLSELETLLIISNELNYLSNEDFKVLHNKIKLITVQISSLIHVLEKKKEKLNNH